MHHFPRRDWYTKLESQGSNVVLAVGECHDPGIATNDDDRDTRALGEGLTQSELPGGCDEWLKLCRAARADQIDDAIQSARRVQQPLQQ
jgi:hypothetical protein